MFNDDFVQSVWVVATACGDFGLNVVYEPAKFKLGCSGLHAAF